MLQLFLTHLQGLKKDAIKSPILILMEVALELLLPLMKALDKIQFDQDMQRPSVREHLAKLQEQTPAAKVTHKPKEPER